MSSQKSFQGMNLSTAPSARGIFPWLLLAAVLVLVSCAPGTASPTGTPVAPPTETPDATATATATATAVPSATPTPDLPAPGSILTLEEVDRDLRAYPGPVHYQGDLLTFEINLGEFVEPGDSPVIFQVEGQEPVQVPGEWKGSSLLAQFDTTGLTGDHRLSIKGEHEGVKVDTTYQLELLAASRRPEQERDPAWVTREIPCCTLHYITGTAAARDIDWIARTAQQAAEDFDEFPTVDVTEKIDIYFSDRMWFNGAFGGSGELFIVYTDRHYGPTRGEEGLEILVRHELGHAVFPIFSYGEGLSVYLAGGHYKPEPIPRRGAALLETEYYIPGQGPVSQHEIIYLHQAAMINYIIDAYGWQVLWDYVEADSKVGNPEPGERDEILQEALGVSRETFREDFLEWLGKYDPGQQLQDLKLTVQLQEIRRDYQERYAPRPQFLLGTAEETFARPEYLRVNIREPRTPAHMAVELLIANAQQALNDGQYHRVRGLIPIIEDVVTTGRLEEPLARAYGDVVLALARQGFETVSLDLQGNEAHVVVTASPPELQSFIIHKADGTWQMGPAPAGHKISPTPFPTVPPSSPTPTPPPATPAVSGAAATDLPENTLLYDDFTDPASGWDVYEQMKISYGYEDGTYRIYLGRPGGVYWFDNGESYEDVAVEVQVTLVDGPELNRVGVHCRQNNETLGNIQFLIDGKRRYGVMWSGEGRPTYLGMEGMLESDAIRPIGEPNVLRAVCEGDTLSFYANGELLHTVEDTVSTGEGPAGLVASAVGGEGFDAAYDYILITEP